ncbi:MAG: histidine phosphatase family protein [Cocleimonas sp.]
MNKNNITILDLLRHGELETKGLFCAMPDEPLSEKGMQDLINITKNKQWDVLVSSPYARCRSFVITLNKELGGNSISYNNAFQEMDFGRWMGVSAKQLWEDEPEKLSQLWKAPQDFIAPDGESMKDFKKRVERAVKELVNKHENQSILLVTHAGVIRSILSMVLAISPVSVLKFNIAYAQMIRLHCYSDGQFSLQFSILADETNSCA